MQAVVSHIIDETPSVKRFYMTVQGTDHFEFLPGQFVALHFPDDQSLERSYSLANAPDGSNRIELCVVLNPGGKFTPGLWALRPKDALEISGPRGSFVLPEDIVKDLCFICTGTGVAPFRSMIRHIFDHDIPHRRIWLIFGARYEADLLYRKEFEDLAEQYPEFSYIPVLSRDQEWPGERGYVHAVYESLFADGRDARFYVCGWQNMCREARQRLKLMGYNRRQYFFEEYDG